VIQIPCPYCGPRNSTEFRHVGEARRRPDPASAERTEWRRYLYVHDNPLGWVHETWFHGSGCRRFLDVERHTGSNEVRSARPAGSRADVDDGPAAAASPAVAEKEVRP
jgi:heterotetrameric sarcosine oxidase delta subunit